MNYLLAAVFTVVVQALSLSEFLPVPVAVLIGGAWVAVLALLMRWIAARPARSARTEDILLAVGCTAMALLAFGGAIGLLMMRAALQSSSVTGETMVLMFLPSIPIAIAANVPAELFVLPGLLILGWRPGPRRALIVAAAAVCFVLRVWTYVTFASDRLDFAATERSTTPLTAAERRDLTEGLHLDDPRWVLNLVVFGLLLSAAFYGRRRQSRASGVREEPILPV